jgi:DNA-binding transcriptional MerR regulator
MQDGAMSIGELAAASGLTRRAVRFYVEQKLIPAPAGVGRGRHYGIEHLNQLRRIGELQSAGHSLDEIRQILAGQQVTPSQLRRRVRPLVQAELLTRLQVADGIELNFDARRFAPAGRDLARLRDQIRAAFGIDVPQNSNDPDSEQSTGGLDGND